LDVKKNPAKVGSALLTVAFIHAPGRGKKVRQESLERGYFKENFCGGRACLGELSAQKSARTK
jgi:cell wall-associated NlpC family hydrolase